MTRAEFDMLDELYFLTAFPELAQALGQDAETVKPCLERLLNKGWVKCFSSPSEELSPEKTEFERNYMSYFYLATKEGLLAHNGS